LEADDGAGSDSDELSDEDFEEEDFKASTDSETLDTGYKRATRDYEESLLRAELNGLIRQGPGRSPHEDWAEYKRLRYDLNALIHPESDEESSEEEISRGEDSEEEGNEDEESEEEEGNDDAESEEGSSDEEGTKESDEDGN
jgi:hypothetical protein